MYVCMWIAFILLAGFQEFTAAETLTFTDTQQFIDLSTYNFYTGRNVIHEHTLVARPGKQVNLYLFTNNVNQYFIRVYDGNSDDAPELSTVKFIPKNDQEIEYPQPIISTGGKMFIRMRADISNMTATVDFQAMATDYSQPGCENLVVSVNANDDYPIIKLAPNNQGGSCYYVFHANDVVNSPLSTQRINTGYNSSYYKLFKGLYTDNEHLIVKLVFT